MVRSRRKNNLFQWLLQPFLPKRGLEHQPDYVLLITIGLLIFFGLLFLSSASSTLAFYKYQDTYRFVKQQILHGLLPGILFFYIAFRINYKHYKKFTWFFLIASFILLSLVFFGALGSDYGTAQSWIVVGGRSFQTSELVKLAFVLFLAGWLSEKGKDIIKVSSAVTFTIILLIISFFIIKQPDIGTLSIILLTSVSMYFVAGAKWTHFTALVGGGAIAFLAMIKAAPYRMNRFVAWLNPDFDPQGIGWQIKQSLIAIGSGGWLGLGLGSSRQKSYLPMPANDSIFAVVAEEIGFIFTIIFLALFAILMLRGFRIIRHSEDNFAKLIALGITIWISLQIFINIAGMLQLLPLTGVPLPFISLGGSNLMVTLLSMGILANISRFTTRH
ncbi:cell division protein FtsW [Candidatus Parcubacteria bacterium]|jgi:cell division protein FtsW|nr:cell division protein FtsW [Candidatus Parcubacteria bacterium]MBT7228832.1 cell division protein FtsW [Candidatus Parcubacteria bacterium]